VKHYAEPGRPALDPRSGLIEGKNPPRQCAMQVGESGEGRGHKPVIRFEMWRWTISWRSS
jgi:hypothetical protein